MVEEVQESQGPSVARTHGPRVQRSMGLKVPWFQSQKDQDISKSHSNTSLTLKKVHLVFVANK